MPRRTMPEPKRLAEVTIERRHITAFAELLTALGLGDVRVEVDDRLEDLLTQAVAAATRLSDELRVERMRAIRLQAAAAPPAAAPALDYSHHVQWRAVDGSEGVVIRGEWTPSGEEQMAKQFLANEMATRAEWEHLIPQRLVRCGHFHITSIATPDEQAPPY